MEFDPENNNEVRESMSSLRFNITELERKYLEENDRYRRNCLALQETVARLEEDRRTLRERELMDQETIKSLLEQIDAKEREFARLVAEHSVWVKKCGELEAQLSKLASKTAAEFEKKERELKEKFVEVSERNRQLEENAAKAAAKGKEHGGLEAQILKIVGERFHLVEKEKGVESAKGKGQSSDNIGGKAALEIDDELPERTVECFAQQKSSPGPTRKRVSIVVDSDGESGFRDSDIEEDGISLSQLRNENLPGVAESNKDLGPLNGAKVTFAEVADARTLPESANNTQEEENKRCSGLNKKTKLSDLSRSSTVRNPFKRRRSSTARNPFKRHSRLNKNTRLSDLSRSSTVRNPFSTVCSGVADNGVQASRTSTGHRYSTWNSKNQKSQRAYTERIPSSDQAGRAKMRAETLQSSLMSCNLSFVKATAPSNVNGGKRICLPKKFCKENLPVHNSEMILEDERNLEYKVSYISEGSALCGGWQRFALAHNLELGDVLLFELHKPARFKVYIVKAIPEESPEDSDDKMSGEHIDGADKLADTNTTDYQDVDDLCDFQKKPPKAEHVTPTGRESATNTCNKSSLFRAYT